MHKGVYKIKQNFNVTHFNEIMCKNPLMILELYIAIDSMHSFRASDIALKAFLFFPNGPLSALKSLLNHSRG